MSISFKNTRRGELSELQKELNLLKIDKKKDAVKKVQLTSFCFLQSFFFTKFI